MRIHRQPLSPPKFPKQFIDSFPPGPPQRICTVVPAAGSTTVTLKGAFLVAYIHIYAQNRNCVTGFAKEKTFTENFCKNQ